MTTYYLISALLTFLSLAIIIFTFEVRKTNYYFMLWFVIMAIANGGYLALALSDSLSEAVLANKICYLGGCFVQPVAFFLTCTICNYSVSKWLRVILYTFSFVVYGMVLSIGYSDIYYKETYLDKFGGATVLGHTYGIGHAFFYVILYGYIVVELLILIYAAAKKRTVSRKNIFALLILEVVTIFSFTLGRGINPYFEIMPLMYVIDGWILIYLYRRGMMYSIEDNIAATYGKTEQGYIMFDNRLNYLGCNTVAAGIFPNIKGQAVDKPIIKDGGCDIILEWLQKYIEDNAAHFEYESGEEHYECYVEKMWHREKISGYMLELRKDTDKWKYVSLLSNYNSRLEQMQLELEQKVSVQTEELKEQQMLIKKVYVQTVTALSEAVDAKDRYTSGHSKRVAEYARLIAEKMGKSKEEQEEIYHAGLLHDVGKIRIPANIINKEGKLTDEEYNIIKLHSVTGYHILRGISENSIIAIAAKYHHERYDGNGYPNGLIGDKIPEVARILGVADSYDAMTSNRSYRKALPQEVVRGEIERCKGTQFDPFIADIMLQMIDEDKDYNMKQNDLLERRILTVDDEAMNNKIIAHIMRDEPMYEMVSAQSGKEALEILENQRFNLILLDVKMPEMDGLETLRRIREKHQTPVVLMTGDKNLDTSTEFAALGCDDYITKPFLPLLIKEVIQNLTERTNIGD